jgi:hypothetical protein
MVFEWGLGVTRGAACTLIPGACGMGVQCACLHFPLPLPFYFPVRHPSACLFAASASRVCVCMFVVCGALLWCECVSASPCLMDVMESLLKFTV